MQTIPPTRLLLIAASPLFVHVFLRDQVRFLRGEGFDVHVACSTGDPSFALEDLDNVHSIPLARSIAPWSDLQSLWHLTRLMHRLRPAIVHAHTPKAGLLGALAAWLTRVPVRIHTIHGLRSETLKGSKRRLVESMERLTGVCSTHCLAVSPSLRQEVIRRRLCAPAKLRVLGFGSCTGIPVDYLQWAGHRERARILRAEHRIPKDGLLVTYIGRIARDKGIHTLAEAWSLVRDRCPDAMLLIAGPEDETDPCDPAVLRALDLDGRVLRPFRFVDDVAPLLAASDLFVQPSFREGLGVAALEASAMRVPVIASRVTGLVDAVASGRTGVLVNAHDAVALAAEMENLLKYPRLRSSMGKEGLRFVARRFDRRIVLNNINFYYRELLSGPRPTSPVRRAADMAVAATLLVLCLPLLLLIALSLAVTMGTPILFRQPRAGLDEKPFLLYKFRTMRAPHPHESALGSDAVRTTSLGLLLRRLSLDELPQLWNVLRGEMSLIGPRPLLMDYVPRYNPFERRRHAVRPGITGWAQVNGRNHASWQQKFALDVWYVDHQSVWLDLTIVWRTLGRLLRPVGIVPAGQSAMPEFTGSPAE